MYTQTWSGSSISEWIAIDVGCSQTDFAKSETLTANLGALLLIDVSCARLEQRWSDLIGQSGIYESLTQHCCKPFVGPCVQLLCAQDIAPKQLHTHCTTTDIVQSCKLRTWLGKIHNSRNGWIHYFLISIMSTLEVEYRTRALCGQSHSLSYEIHKDEPK